MTKQTTEQTDAQKVLELLQLLGCESVPKYMSLDDAAENVRSSFDRFKKAEHEFLNAKILDGSDIKPHSVKLAIEKINAQLLYTLKLRRNWLQRELTWYSDIYLIVEKTGAINFAYCKPK